MRLFILLLILPSIALATGGGKVPAPAPSATASAGLKANQTQVANFAAFGAMSLSAPTSQYIGGTTNKNYSISAPSFSNASTCPIGVIPLIGGTTGAEFCRALWAAMVTGDKGPVCGSSWHRDGLDDWCADWDARHPKAQGFKWSVDPS